MRIVMAFLVRSATLYAVITVDTRFSRDLRGTFSIVSDVLAAFIVVYSNVTN